MVMIVVIFIIIIINFTGHLRSARHSPEFFLNSPTVLPNKSENWLRSLSRFSDEGPEDQWSGEITCVMKHRAGTQRQDGHVDLYKQATVNFTYSNATHTVPNTETNREKTPKKKTTQIYKNSKRYAECSPGEWWKNSWEIDFQTF